MSKAEWNGAVLAESDKCVEVENNCYFPPDSVDMQYFENSTTTSVCGWKGTCNYYNVRVGDEVNNDAAWVYRTPKDEAKNIENYVAFWKGVHVTK
ncbi:MAG TPA: DUF427 domain-containing protein [Planktothrix sp.]|jgi:uncharacterized protein (DUF427 family)